MSDLVSRSEIFSVYKNLSLEIKEIQNVMFEDDLDLFETDQERELYLQQFDAKDLKVEHVTSFFKVISIVDSDLMTYTKVLAEKLGPLLIDVGVKELVILSHLKMNLLGSNLKHKYKPAKNAFSELSRIVQSNHYDGAIKIRFSELPQYVNIMFWIERCDASAPEFIYFHDTLDRFNFSICNEGNLHINEYGQELLTRGLLEKHGWFTVEGICSNKFTATSKIEGRITSG